MCKLNVGVIFGGKSPEHSISLISASTVMSNMSDEKYNIIPIYIDKSGNWLIYEGPFTDKLENIQWEKFGVKGILSPDTSHKGILRIIGDKIKIIPLDVVFPVMHGENGEDGRIQGLLEMSEIPYVGCGVMASAIGIDKGMTKKVVSNIEGVNQAKHLEFYKEEIENNIEEVTKKIRYKLGYPCFIKPATLGSSVGISKVNNKKELIEALNLGIKYGEKIIVEKMIVGRELECGALGLGRKDVKISQVGEVLTGGEFYDFESKYENPESKTIIPADIPKEISEEIRESAKKIFNTLECSGISRIDFFLEDKTNKVIFNEINTLPGFTSISMYGKLWSKEGIETRSLIDKLIKLALEK